MIITKQQIMLNHAEGIFTVFKLTQLSTEKGSFLYVLLLASAIHKFCSDLLLFNSGVRPETIHDSPAQT